MSAANFDRALGASRGLPATTHAARDRAATAEQSARDRSELMRNLKAAARDVATPAIFLEFDQLVLICEAYDLNFDPESLTADERRSLLVTWQAALR